MYSTKPKADIESNFVISCKYLGLKKKYELLVTYGHIESNLRTFGFLQKYIFFNVYKQKNATILSEYEYIYICSLASYFLVHFFELQFSTKLSFYKGLNDGGIFFVRKLPVIKMKKLDRSPRSEGRGFMANHHL